MSEKSLKIHPDWIQEVKAAYRSRYSNQTELAEKADISSVDTVSKFLNAKSVSRANFWKLCDLLEVRREQVVKGMSHDTSSLDKSVNMVTITKASDDVDVCGDILQSEVLKSGQENLNFIGRDKEVGFIHHLTVQEAKCILIVGTGGVGKTTLAKNYLEQSFNSYIEFSIAKERSNIASIASLVEEKLRSLGEETGKEFMVSLERLKCRLQRERIGVLIDNLEPALDGNGQFVDEHRGYIELLRVLTGSSLRSTTLITSREPLNEALDIKILMLGGLKDKVWHSFFSQQGINADISIVTEVHRAFGGNALAMKMLCHPIKTYHDGDLAAYWQECKTESGLVVEQTLENLVREQFDRLENNCPEAYKLLCRIGCFRYQDVPTIPKEGLCSLLWDVMQGHHIRIINFLRNRSLVEFYKGEYFLHPVIRTESISRLREGKEWEETNLKAAAYWTHSTKTTGTLKDVLRAFEAYYHYFCINAYNLAGEVIIKPRSDRFYSSPHYLGELLGRSLYRLGLLEQTISSINLIINQVNIEICKSQLYNILGDCYWLNGKPSKAIDCHQISKNLANIYSETIHDLSTFDPIHIRRVGQLSRSYLLNTGLCKLDLWELEEAYNLFAELKSISENTDFYSATLSANFCLAVTSARLEMKDQAASHTAIAYSQLHMDLGYWTGGYKFVFLGETYEKLNNIPKSVDMYSSAISLANETTFTQVKGKAFYGLAVIFRKHKKFKASILHNLVAIELLIKIGANSDLAEAYLQLGLTYRAMAEHDQAEKYKAKAIEFFAQTEAPKQIERVNKAFGENVQ